MIFLAGRVRDLGRFARGRWFWCRQRARKLGGRPSRAGALSRTLILARPALMRFVLRATRARSWTRSGLATGGAALIARRTFLPAAPLVRRCREGLPHRRRTPGARGNGLRLGNRPAAAGRYEKLSGLLGAARRVAFRPRRGFSPLVPLGPLRPASGATAAVTWCDPAVAGTNIIAGLQQQPDFVRERALLPGSDMKPSGQLGFVGGRKIRRSQMSHQSIA